MDEDVLCRRQGEVQAVLSSIPKPDNTRMKIISMGAASVGKSCLIKRYCEERFIPKYISTIGIDYGVKRVLVEKGTVEVRVNFWDLAGAVEYYDIRNEFYKDAQGAILVYDVTNLQSFQVLEKWLQEAKQCGAKDLMTVVCANKVDLPKRVVSEADGKKWALSKGFGYFEVSANTGQNVNAMFDTLFQDCYTLKKL